MKCEYKNMRIVLDSLTINPKYFDKDPIVSHKSEMEQISKSNYICSLAVKNNLMQLQSYCKEFIFPLKHHTHITVAGVHDIAIFLATGRSE